MQCVDDGEEWCSQQITRIPVASPTLLSLPPLSSAAVCWTVSVEFLVCVCRRWRQVAQSAGELHACLDTTATHHWLTATLSSALMCWIVSLEAVVQYVDDGSKWCKPLLRCSTVLLASAISTTEASTFAFTFGVTAGAGFGRCGFAYGALFANRSRSGNFWSSLGFTRAFKSSTLFFFSLADPLLGDCTKILYKERAVFCMALFLSLRKMISAIVSYGNVRQTK